MNFTIKNETNELTSRATSILCMPEELRKFTLSTCISCSPYNKNSSGSFYNTTEKTWDYTPDGAIRVSDHWNFFSWGTMHCVTDVDNSKIEGMWVVAKYNAVDGLWHVISADAKEFDARNKKDDRNSRRQFVDPLVRNKENRTRVLRELQEKKRKAIRAKKIKNGTLWVSFTVKLWTRSGRRVRQCGTSDIVGQLVYESGCKMVVRINGREVEYRACYNYKELSRKPYTKKTATACAVAA